jgi:hypothetical protein
MLDTVVLRKLYDEKDSNLNMFVRFTAALMLDHPEHQNSAFLHA